jgi:hypothetical protein
VQAVLLPTVNNWSHFSRLQKMGMPGAVQTELAQMSETLDLTTEHELIVRFTKIKLIYRS